MQQLSLFTNSVSVASRIRGNKRVRKGVQPLSGARWDLWTQETEGEKELALFFLDIRNFTPLIQRHRPSDVIYIVKKLFSTFQNIIRNHHGRIIETSGDGFYAAFGFNGDVKESVNATVKAGRAILETLEDLNAHSFEMNLGQRIEVGIGVHVGKVATGNLHLGSKDHFVVMGYPVNVASRLQVATKELNNNFIVSADVFAFLNGPLLDNEGVRLNLKGVTGPCKVYPIGKAYKM